MYPKHTKIIDATQLCLLKANSLFNINIADVSIAIETFPPPPTPLVAAQALCAYYPDIRKTPTNFQITYNSWFVDNHISFMLSRVIPHEVAHIVMYKKVFTREKHGLVWRNTCKRLGGTGKAEEILQNKG